MSALTTRDVLATGLHGLVCTRHASLDECEDAAVYRDDADALIASGAVVDAATLADDNALVGHLENWVPLGFVPGKDPYSSVTEAARAFLTALAAALSERSSR